MSDILTMSTKELSRLEIIQQLQKRELKQEKAAEILQLSIRQVKRLLASYRSSGTPALISKKRGKPSNNKLPLSLKQSIKSIILTKYPGFGPTLAWEKLRGYCQLSGEDSNCLGG